VTELRPSSRRRRSDRIILAHSTGNCECLPNSPRHGLCGFNRPGTEQQARAPECVGALEMDGRDRSLLVFRPGPGIIWGVEFRVLACQARRTGLARASNRLGKTMKNHLRVSLVFALAMSGSAGSLCAQMTANFSRVTTSATVRRTPSAPTSRVLGVTRGAENTRVAMTSASTGALGRYSSQVGRTEASTSGVPRYSSSQEQPIATREIVPQPQSRNYFPGMRASRTMQQPVTLTARTTMGGPGICTPSRSHMMGGGGAHR
jgi:hypothetical protein